MNLIYQLDNKILPGDDLYHHVNNNWLHKNPLPPSESRWGTFSELREKSFKDLKKIIEELKNEGPKNSKQQKIIDFYISGETRDKYHQKSVEKINELINIIQKAENPNQLGQILGTLHRYGINPFWNLFVDLDDKNSRVQVLRLDQGGLTLPSRDYYLEDSTHMAKVRNQYSIFAHKLLEKRDFTPLNFEPIFEIEQRLAEYSWTPAACRDSVRMYNPFNLNQLAQTIPSFNWIDYFQAIGLPRTDHLVLDQPDFFEKTIQFVITSDWGEIQAYLIWSVLMSYAGKINTEYSNLFFEFFGKVVSGQVKQKPLWKRLLIAADSAVGELLGEMYVASVFPETSKHTILEMVEKIRDVYSKRISNLDWMSPKSQKIAISKLNNIKVRVGYPDKWRDYSHLKIDRYNFIGNLLAAAEHDTKYSLDKVGKRPPIEEWHMTPQTVNAYHDPNRLEIVFPAAILQYPFFDPNSHYAANLAGIGYVIGHEFTHGFDDQGSLFDANGELKPWMTKSEKQSFHLRSKYIRESANNFEVIDGVFMIGDLVIGEAIADLGGAELAWQVLQNELSAGAISHTDSNGLDAEHVFFYALATVERQNESAESALQAAKSDPHPDPRFRVNGIVPHMDAFYNVFEISPNDRLYRAPKTRSKIW